MDHLQDTNQVVAAEDRQRPLSSRFLPGLALLVALLLLFLLLMNFLPLRLAVSETAAQATVERGHSGEALPPNMQPGFDLLYQTAGGALAPAVAEALPAALAETDAGAALPAANPNAGPLPRLWLSVETRERLWTPIYARAEVLATFYFASTAAVPWPADAPMRLTESPEIQARGEVTLTDTTRGLISQPAYELHLAQGMAEAVAEHLQTSVFILPPR